ncbi:MAG: hypothetical protein HYU58_06745 [Proteobacteria bacterium]|nr:hypothetical protein [Pseudomonadota bacterium]
MRKLALFANCIGGILPRREEEPSQSSLVAMVQYYPVACRAFLALSLACASATDAAGASNAPCTHDEALEMGAKLHQELDTSSPRWRTAKTEAEKQALFEAFEALMKASDDVLRGDDSEACRQYREIAEEQGIELD